MIVECHWLSQATDDDVVNDIREAIARAGYQVGDCDIISRSGFSGRAQVEVDGRVVGEFEWCDTSFQVN